MTLADQYQQQHTWRSWAAIFDALPPLRGTTVLDLGCGVGDQAADLVAHGARVIGIDRDPALLRVARTKQLTGARFLRSDLRSLPDPGVAVDGLWCSFGAAYFPDLPAVLRPWLCHLRPGGWVATTEVHDLFAHQPLPAPSAALLEAYVGASLAAGRYDFRMGGKLRGYLEQCGLTVSKAWAIPDLELAFDGPAQPEVVLAWQARFARMARLQDFCGPRFHQVRDDFLAALMHADHVSQARVCCCIARLPEPSP
jgi:SAM-dependent methyltransferase